MKSLKKALLILWTLSSLLLLSGCFFTQYIAHYANTKGWKTRIKIQNPHSQQVGVKIECYNDAGTLVATADITIAAYGFYKEYIQDIFAVSIPETGSLAITANEPTAIPKVCSILMFEFEAGPSLAGLQSFQSPQKVVHLPWYEHTATSNTGLGVLNVNPYPVQFFCRAATGDGARTDSTTFTLEAMARKVGYPVDYFPGRLPSDTTLTVYASGKVAAFAITHDSTLQKAEAINGVPQIPARLEDGRTYSFLDLEARATTMLFSPDGGRLYFRTEAPYRLLVMDSRDKSILQTINLNHGGDEALSADGKLLYFSDIGLDKIFQMDTRSLATTEYATYENPWYLDASNDGRWLLTASQTGWHLMSLTGGTAISQSGFSNIQDAMITEDSRYVILCDYTTRKITQYDIETSATTETILADPPNCLHQPAGQTTLYVGCNVHRVYQLSLPSLAVTSNIISAAGGVYELHSSPDGRLLYIPCAHDWYMWQYDTWTGDLKQWLNLGGAVNTAAVAPEGDRLFYLIRDSPYPLRYIQ